MCVPVTERETDGVSPGSSGGKWAEPVTQEVAAAVCMDVLSINIYKNWILRQAI